jgi:starch-binding outer membrane protein, SusD/RagB family
MKKIIFFLAIAAMGLSSCSDYFNPEDDSVVDTGSMITTQREAFYQMNGILKCVQDLGDDYVIGGELRGDLMTTTSNSTQDLRDIEDFSADSTNAYNSESKLYKLINNCNYMISYLDTTVLVKGNNVLKREYVQAKTIRAWAYLQLCLDFGQAYYYTSPVLDSNSHPTGETLRLDALCDRLIADLTPWTPATTDYEQLPIYGTVSSINSNLMFVPVRFMLGELYMWKQNFAQAAEMYYELMLTRRLVVKSTTYANVWTSSTMSSRTEKWTGQYNTLDSTNFVSIIPYNPVNGYTDGLTDMANLCSMNSTTGKYMLKPSSAAINNWDNQDYCFSASNYAKGDLRGLYGSYSVNTVTEGNSDVDYSYITKYENMVYSTHPYNMIARNALVYLRYAEAVNRLGKHQLAFAVLKYGLNKTVMQNDNYVSAAEKTGENYTDFGQITASRADVFSSNGALHDSGCGRSDLNDGLSITGNNDTDSTECVEDFIMNEYALECAFEGNRFHDLMRVAIYRNNPAYLANKVASKFAASRQASVITKLSDENNWYLIKK